jgi:hypothetical protein
MVDQIQLPEINVTGSLAEGGAAATQSIPGVPVLFGGVSISFPTLMTGDVVDALSFGVGPQWGVYQGGSPVVVFDSFLEIDYRQTWNISDYPVERGGFESYNKVYTPFEARVKFAAGGTEANRAELLASVAAIAGTLQLYDVVTPEVVYQSVNVKHYEYRRTATNGLGIITVEMWLEEVRVTVSEDSSTTAGTSSANSSSSGVATDGVTPPAATDVVAPLDPSGANLNNNGVTPAVPSDPSLSDPSLMLWSGVW